MIRSLCRRWPAGLLGTLVIAAATVAATGVAGPAAAATGWVLQSTPNPAGGQLDELVAVSCSSASACTAVGLEETSSGQSLALAERWNGSTWALQTAANPPGDTAVILRGVSCPSATYCVAVGSNSSGRTATAVAETRNGSTWALQSPVSPSGSVLSAVSCTSDSNCEAVGWSGRSSLAENWNGSTWTTQTVPGSGLSAVSCVSASYCDAVTAYWNGSTWTAQAGPTMVPYGISCASASSCEAVGSFAEDATAAYWNGSAWTTQTVPSPGGSVLYGVSCTSASNCVAAGNVVTQTVGYTLAEQWNGSSWSAMTTPNPGGAENALFQGISCPSPTDCTAVGDWYASSPSLAQTLGEQWTG